MTPPSLTCRELVELVTEYLEGALPDDEAARFEGHVDDCPDCSAYLGQLRRTITAVGALREDDLAGPAADTLLHAFRSWRGSPG